MALADREVTYEVHVKQQGRWTMQARYDDGQEGAAVEEAKNLESMPGISATKVIRESYDPEEGTSLETTVYKSSERAEYEAKKAASAAPRASRPAPAPAPPPPPGPAPGPAPAPAAAPKRPRPERGPTTDAWDDFEADEKEKSTVGGIATKIGLITVFSVATATLATMMTGHYLGHIVLMGYDLGDAKTLVGLFIAVFLLTAVPTSFIFLSKESLDSAGGAARKGGRRKSGAASASASGSATSASASKESGADLDSAIDRAVKRGLDLEAEGKSTSIDTEVGSKGDLGDTPVPKPGDSGKPGEPKADDAEAPKPEPEQEQSEATEEEQEPEKKPLSPAAEKQRLEVLKFLSEGLQALPPERRSMSADSKFGVGLFLAGACETLCHENNLDAETTAQVLADCAKIVGYKEGDAARLATKYEEYLLSNARYMQMFQAGRTAVKAYVDDPADGAKHLTRAVEDWRAPRGDEAVAKTVTVMFTDMVGSTKLTQERGDAVAQEVVRTHNRIVREALGMFGGKEIKHTGDGIMASFSATSQSVEAAMFIQQRATAHTKAVPDLPLVLKVGINAGEPIAEDDDLFGTTVQLAARIVDKAQAGEIFVSEIVRGLCAGKPMQFTSRGGYAMKGFGDDITLYEVVWNRPAQTEPAQASSQ